MKTTTFHFLAQAARHLIDLEEYGIPADASPLEHFVRTKSTPNRKQIRQIVELYEKHGLLVRVPGHDDPVGVREAVRLMRDDLGVKMPVAKAGEAVRGRPVKSTLRDLSALGEAVKKHGYRIRDIAEIAGLYASSISAALRGPQPMTDERLEKILNATQILFTGNKAALKELRQLEKEWT